MFTDISSTLQSTDSTNDCANSFSKNPILKKIFKKFSDELHSAVKTAVLILIQLSILKSSSPATESGEMRDVVTCL